VHRVLFVCTGNIFRSMTAEYALRRALGEAGAVHVSSAGTEDFPHVVWPQVREYLRTCGLDVSAHCRRTLTQEILRDSSHIIAMSDDHQDFIRERFGLHVPLFTAACGLLAQGLPDVGEAVADFQNNPQATAAHVRMTIDKIIELTPRLAQRLAAGIDIQARIEDRR
jgi:protein-tyrosine phosphatase